MFRTIDSGKNSIRIFSIYVALTIVLILLQSFWIMEKFGLTYNQNVTAYALFNFLTEKGRFDDFYNTLSLVSKLPDPNSGYVVTPLVLEYSRLVAASPLLGHFLHTIIPIGALFCSINIFFRKDIGVVSGMAIAVLSLLLYPTVYVISRGNAEFIAVSLILFSLAYYLKTERQNFALCLFIAAISVKPTVILYGVLFPFTFFLKRYPLLLIGLAVNVWLIYLSGIGLENYLTRYIFSLKSYYNDYVIGAGGDLFNNSLFGLAKFLYAYILGIQNYESLCEVLTYFSTIFVAAFVLWFWIQKRNHSSEHIAAIACTTVLMAQVSADYRLVHFILPFLLALISRDIVVLVLTGLIMLPKHFVFFKVVGLPAMTFQTVLNPLFILFLLVLCIYRIRRHAGIRWIIRE